MWNKKLGKVFTSAVCVGLTATMLAGCGKAETVEEVSAKEEASLEASEPKIVNRAEPIREEDEEEEEIPEWEVPEEPQENYEVWDAIEEEPSEDDSVSKVYVHEDNYNSLPEEVVFSIDTDGKVSGKFMIKDIEAILKKTDGAYKQDQFFMEKDGIAYFHCYGISGSTEEGKEAVFAVDGDKMWQFGQYRFLRLLQGSISCSFFRSQR